LCGRATYGTATGRLFFNGQENTVASLSRLVGFVPQEDIMHRDLTVREILKSYAIMRLPRLFQDDLIERVVQDVIEALQLEHVSDQAIGDEATRGISGGQRKRVNVGIEMVADPSLLFLDEPTSGLDSTTSFDLVFALNALATKGVNVIMVLHQPSYPLYQVRFFGIHL
jgi:ABC-type multidrug transport system ATPase subunit